MWLRCNRRKATEKRDDGQAWCKPVGDMLLHSPGVCILLAVWLLSAGAKAEEAPVFEINLPAQSVAESLIQLSEQCNTLLLFPYQVASKLDANPVHGTYTLQDALTIMLQGTGFSGGLSEKGVLMISLTESTDTGDKTEGEKDMNSKSKKSSYMGRLGSALAAVFLAPAAGAQEGTSAGNEASVIEEIVVTATRRETELQKSAISVSAMSGDQLDNLGIYQVADAVGLMAGVTSITNQPGLNQVTIRGVNTSSYETTGASIITNPLTAAYLDQVPVSSTILKMPDFRFVDMARVEVLKGPQGTLFGQSAMGGAVRYITNKPNTDGVAGGVGGYGSSTTDRGGANYGLDGYANIPLSDRVALRVVGYSHQNDGFLDVVGTPIIANTPSTPQSEVKRANDESTVGGRASLNWDVTDRTSLYVSYLYHDVDLPSNNLIGSTYTPTGNPLNNGAPLNLTKANLDRFVAMHLGPSKDEAKVYTLELTSEFDWATASLILGRKDVFGYRLFEANETAPITEAFGNHDNTLNLETNTAEFRLVSSTNNTFFDWIFGVWHEDSDGVAHAGATITGNDIIFGPFVIPQGTPAIDGTRDLDYRESAIYGELTFHFSDQLSFTAGYRRADVENNYTWTSANGLFDALTGTVNLVGIDQKTQEDVDTYKFNLSYTVSDDLLVYALASSGYRPGGFNPGNALVAIPDTHYESDSLWNYELGVRSSWMEERLMVNAWLYRLDWSDIQTRASSGPPFFYSSTQNAGEAEVDGLELETRFRANDNLTLAFNYTYNNTEITRVGETSVGTGLLRKGDRLPGTPRNAVSFLADWQSPLSGGKILLANLTYQSVGDRTVAIGLDRQMPSYQLVNMQVGVAFDNGATVTLFADNATDEVTVQAISMTALPDFEYISVNRPRTIGLRARYSF